MELVEIFSDERGHTHFRKSDLHLEERHYAPPSRPVRVSADMRLTHGNFLVAPPGWDDQFHPTPNRQLAVLLSGTATISATDGQTINVQPGSVILLNDQASRGHLTRVRGSEASFLLVGLAE